MDIENKCDYRLTIDTLTDITVSMVEHHELLDPILTLNFIDHYRAYVHHYADEKVGDTALINFESFITNQAMLYLASTYIALETGEPLTAPKALTVSTPLRVESVVEKVVQKC